MESAIRAVLSNFTITLFVLGLVVAAIAIFRRPPPRTPALVYDGPACFLWGAGLGHVYQIATTRNTAPGNAGTILYTDFLLPAIGFALLWLARRAGPPALQSG